MLFTNETAGDRHAWLLKLGRVDRREEAKSRALAGIGQILDALRAGRRRETLSLLGGLVIIGC